MSELDEALYQFDVMVGESRVPDNSNLQIIVEAARRWAAVQEAITNEGPQPRHHRQVMKRHRKEWPTLWASLIPGDAA